MLKKRSPVLFFLLGPITLGIYPLVVLCTMSEDINRVCEGDGKHQMNYILACLLGCVTLGIYPYIWLHKAAERLKDNAYRYGPNVRVNHSGSEIVLWMLLGMFIVVGPFIAFWYFMDDLNAYVGYAGYVTPAPYTVNGVERNQYCMQMSNVQPQMQQNMNVDMTPPTIPSDGYGPMSNNQNNMSQPGNDENGWDDGIPVGNDTYPQAGSVDAVPRTQAGDGYRPMAPSTIMGTVGMYKDFRFPIQFNESVIIGTDSTVCNIIIYENCKYVSHKHCSIKYDTASELYIVRDYSSNGTYTVSGERLASNYDNRLKKGSIIYLGNRDNCFRLE